MAKFVGEFNHSIDAKGRVIIPAKLRDELGASFVVTMGLDGCLYAYPMNEWEKFLEKLEHLPGSRDARTLQRMFMANAANVDMDKQGRALIPTGLREKAGLDKDIVFIGVLSKIEIWSKERLGDTSDDAGMEDIADRMSEYGLSF